MRFREMGQLLGKRQWTGERTGSNSATAQTADKTVAGSECGTRFAEASSPGESHQTTPHGTEKSSLEETNFFVLLRNGCKHLNFSYHKPHQLTATPNQDKTLCHQPKCGSLRPDNYHFKAASSSCLTRHAECLYVHYIVN